jgi:multidrug efflux pump subunit AcrA (membrane-fusion protein)
MKKIMLITLLLCSLGVVPLGCASQSASVPQNQIVTVQRGNLTVDITASGNLALSVTQDLAFEIAGTTANPLTVAEVLVEEGESVEKGQVLARADTSAWQDQLTSLERAVTNAKRTVTQKQLDLLGKQISLNSAQQALEQAEQGTTTTSTGDIRTTTTDPLDIEMKQLQLELAQGNLELAQIAVADAQTAVDDAEKALKDAQDASPEVTAPFAGFITTVSVSGGDEVKKGTVAVTLADPNKFEADILVSEMDIPQVKVGGDAAVTVSAMSGLSLPAKVTHISPTATIQSGVVNYRVKVEVESLETIMQQRQQAMQQAQQQAGQQGQGQQGTQRQQTPAGQGTQRQIPTTVPAAVSQTIQLRQGLTITVSIIVDQRTDVLLVPNGAVTTRGRQTYVQVSLPDGTTAERAITTGISDWQYTEVTDGLSEGEQVVVPQGTTTTTTTTKKQSSGGQMFIPGLGGR